MGTSENIERLEWIKAETVRIIHDLLNELRPLDTWEIDSIDEALWAMAGCLQPYALGCAVVAATPVAGRTPKWRDIKSLQREMPTVSQLRMRLSRLRNYPVDQRCDLARGTL